MGDDDDPVLEPTPYMVIEAPRQRVAEKADHEVHHRKFVRCLFVVTKINNHKLKFTV